MRRNLLEKGYELRADEADLVTTNVQMSDFGFSRRGIMPSLPMGFVVTKVSDNSVKIKTLVEDQGESKWIREYPYNSLTEREYSDIKLELCRSR